MSQPTAFRLIDERLDGDGAVFTVVVTHDSPFFEGHFPGQPVLPAIGQLAILTALVERVATSSVSLTGVDGLRFSRQVLPGDRIEVRLGTLQDGDTPFVIRCRGASVSRGTLRLAKGSA